MLPLTSHFEELHLQSGRKIADIMSSKKVIKAYKGHYELERDDFDHSWSVYFYADDSPNEVLRVQTGLLSLEDAKRAQVFHNVDRLKAIVIARGLVKSDK